VPQRDANVDVTRRIAADPTSAVLLLAAPAAAEFWPGLSLADDDLEGQLRVRVTLPPAAAQVVDVANPVQAVVRAHLPQRTPTSYVMEFSFDAADLPTTSGTLTLTYAPVDVEQMNATIARLQFTVSPQFAVDGFLCALELSARTFLDRLAAAAENRSHAA
jgi:hypothetical protein